MIKSAAQLKGKIKNLANQNPGRAENLMRLFFMERFLERVSVSEYKDQFVLKGGMLTASLLGVNMRTTMDIDTTVNALPLNVKDISTDFII
ncbi:MAG: nucleotidyl transferase AbiEii/AbiGii toxin family protein [Anaerolineaceae bacterium]|nr:nucleotidyl transferase AbiEii/AbiGii toxin family protein [Anaerolineaceae bacterium]